jgi:hypothetical protein
MANDISLNAKRDLFNMEIRTDMNRGVGIMMSFVIKWLAEELIMTAEFLLMNAGTLIK